MVFYYVSKGGLSTLGAFKMQRWRTVFPIFPPTKKEQIKKQKQKCRDMMIADVFFFRNFPDQIMKQMIEKLIDGRGSNYLQTSFD